MVTFIQSNPESMSLLCNKKLVGKVHFVVSRKEASQSPDQVPCPGKSVMRIRFSASVAIMESPVNRYQIRTNQEVFNLSGVEEISICDEALIYEADALELTARS